MQVESLHDKRLYQGIDKFIADIRGQWQNKIPTAIWLRGDYTKLYFRVTWNYIVFNIIPTLVIASIAIKDEFQLQGILPNLLDYLEAKDYCVMIEQILHDNLMWYFARHGYTVCENMPRCMYKLPYAN